MLDLGIYIGLSQAEYLADPGLGSGAQRELALNPTEFQYERLFGDPDEDTRVTIWGSLLHAATLEGPESVEAGFAVEPEVPEGCLVTMNDLRAKCDELGVKPGQSKASATKAIREWKGPAEVPIWSEIEEQFERTIGDRTVIKRRDLRQIEVARLYMQADETLGKVMNDGQLMGGIPEVSIFYEHKGIRLRARLDYLLPHAIVDVKSYRPWGMANNVTKAAIHQVAKMRYDLQAVSYRMAWHAAKEAFKEGRWFLQGNGDPAGLKIAQGWAGEFLGRCFKRTAPNWIWVMVKAIGSPEPIVMEWTEKNAPFSMGSAAQELEEGLAAYVRLTAEFGPDNIWPPRHKPLIIRDTDWPTFMGQG